MTEAKARVVITDFISDSLDIEREILQGVATVEAFDAYHENELHGRIESADAIMLYHNLALSAETIQRLESEVNHLRAQLQARAVAPVPTLRRVPSTTSELASRIAGLFKR